MLFIFSVAHKLDLLHLPLCFAQHVQSLAMVSDAGMPGISDPGHALITAAIEAGVQVIPLPGPCAFVCALVASGLPTTSFTFHGFLSPKSVARRARLSELRDAPETLVFYAPPHGLVKVRVLCTHTHLKYTCTHMRICLQTHTLTRALL